MLRQVFASLWALLAVLNGHDMYTAASTVGAFFFGFMFLVCVFFFLDHLKGLLHE